MSRRRARAPWLTVVLLSTLGVAAASDDPEPSRDGWHGRVQLRRENVDRGTSEETTRTYLRSVAFPDEQTDFGGSPFNPRLGDSKIRFRFAPFSAGRFALSYFIESTFPSADPEELGSGKYQLSAGVSATTRIPVPQAMRPAHQLRFTSQLQQRTRWLATRRGRTSTTPNWTCRSGIPGERVDWEQNGKSGAVSELEYGRRLDAKWSLWLMAGGLLWGEGVKGTYGAKVMLGVDRWF